MIIDEVYAALISLVIGTLLGRELSRFLYRPRVIVRFKSLAPLHTADGYFNSIEIANLGRTVATNCIGVLTLFHIDKEDILEQYNADPIESLPDYKESGDDLSFPRDQLLSPKFFRELRGVSLCWSRWGNPATMDINPGMTQVLDVCKFQIKNESRYIIFPSEHGWRKVRIRIKMREVQGRIMVCPSNEFPTMIKFKIDMDEEGMPRLIPLKQSFKERVKQVFFKQRYFFD